MPLTAYQLRFCPARYIHESHLPAVLLRLLPALPDWRRQSVLNAWLLEQLELDCAFRMPAQLGGLALTRRRRWNGPWAGSVRCCTARPCGRCWTVRGYGASARRSANRASVSAWSSSTCSSVAGRPAGSGPCRKTRKTAISGAAAWLSGWPPVAMPTAVFAAPAPAPGGYAGPGGLDLRRTTAIPGADPVPEGRPTSER